MLEIPESHTIASQLRNTLTGKRIASVCANSSPHGFAFYYGDPAEYPRQLADKQVDAALGDVRLLFRDGTNILSGRDYSSGVYGRECLFLPYLSAIKVILNKNHIVRRMSNAKDVKRAVVF